VFFVSKKKSVERANWPVDSSDDDAMKSLRGSGWCVFERWCVTCVD